MYEKAKHILEDTSLHGKHISELPGGGKTSYQHF
jgi:hypothetical protein